MERRHSEKRQPALQWIDGKRDQVTEKNVLFVVQIISLIAQIISLGALIFYVVKTSQIAEQTKKAAEISESVLDQIKKDRDRETAPRVIVYFDVPYGQTRVYLVVRNVGKGVAENVKLVFTPQLRNSGGDVISKMPIFKDGIDSMPPEHEIRIIFDELSYYLNSKEDLPRSYKVDVSYSGGLISGTRRRQQRIDLTPFEGVNIEDERSLPEIAEDIAQSLKKLANSIVSPDVNGRNTPSR